MDRINRRYLCAALTVSFSTVAGPFAMAYPIYQEAIPYVLGAVYGLTCFGAGFNEILSDREKKRMNSDPRAYCNGQKRIPIEELVGTGNLDTEQLVEEDIVTNNL